VSQFGVCLGVASRGGGGVGVWQLISGGMFYSKGFGGGCYFLWEFFFLKFFSGSKGGLGGGGDIVCVLLVCRGVCFCSYGLGFGGGWGGRA